MPIERSPTNAIEKTCRILCALSDKRNRKLKDISDATGIHKVSVLRVLNTLIQEGLVTRDDQTKEYNYGREVQVMASAMNSRNDLRIASRPSLARLAKRSGDTVLLVAHRGMECVCIERETGDFPIHASTLHVGSRRPLGVGSGPMAVLAWLDEEEQKAALAHIGSRLKPYPRLTLARIRRAIAETLDRGCAIQYDEVVSQVGAIGMPILDPQGRPVGALSISSLTGRIHEREDFLSQLLAKEVAVVREALGKIPKTGPSSR